MGKCVCAFSERKDIDANIVNSVRILSNCGINILNSAPLYQHLLEADYRWLQRWKGIPFAEIPQGFVVDWYDQVTNKGTIFSAASGWPADS